MACRIILRAGNRDSVKGMHEELGLLELDTRRDMHLSFTCHKVVQSDGKNSLSKFFNKVAAPGRRHTRHGNEKNMKVPRVRTNKGRCGIAYRGPFHWNKLSTNLKDIIKYNAFRKEFSRQLSGKFVNHPT